jgi:N6-adenosine-specific RNA methylase IME4
MKNKKYKIIYADPPWEYDDPADAGKRGAVHKYKNVMTIEQLKRMSINKITDKDCILFMWVTMPFLEEVFGVIKAWGFNYKTCGFVWVKRNKKKAKNGFWDWASWFWGMGRWTRSNAELCLIAVKGKPERISASVHSIIDEPIGEHSAKPDEVRKRIIKLCGDLPRLEMFAREETKGWDVFGDQVNNSINISIRSKLK